jgi:hypothetical protein
MTLVSDVLNIHTLSETLNICNIYINGYPFFSFFFPRRFLFHHIYYFSGRLHLLQEYVDHSEENKPLNLPTADSSRSDWKLPQRTRETRSPFSELHRKIFRTTLY